MAIKWTPKVLVLWIANIVLKGIAELTDFVFDLEARKFYAQTTLYGEAEAIEVWLEGFAVVGGEGDYKFIIQQARSNKPWLHNLLSRFVGKAWKIPAIPQLTAHMGVVAELLKAETPETEAKTPRLEIIDAEYHRESSVDSPQSADLDTPAAITADETPSNPE